VGELRVNVLPDRRSRVTMRQAGNLRLLLNAWLMPETVLKCQEGASQVSFSCINAAQPEAAAARGDNAGMSDAGDTAGAQMGTYAVKFGSHQKAKVFQQVAERHKSLQFQSDEATERAMADVDAIAASIV
jgi:hypothetical protein